MIKQSTIDAVYQVVRIEEVISDFVQLKRSGSNFKGLSPFTDERSPSFMVSPVKQIWKDFSSGKGGNIISFLMEHEHFSYPETIKYLARRYNIPIEETEVSNEQKQAQDLRQSMYLVNEFANKFFQKQLQNTEEGIIIGLSYFKERGFTKETIENFELGYSPKSKDTFTSHALQEGYENKYLEATGLSIIKPDYNADRFRERVIFPIHSMSGRILGFGGRILGNNKKLAKYINSPQSEIYDKSKVLYGIHQAKQSISKENNCYLVEGYTDVIQMHQSGISNVVSSSGTALTKEQIALIQRLTSNITVLFDGDAAGIRASLRGIDLILEQGLSVKVCTFPDGEDPDSFAKKFTKTEIEDYLAENAKDFIQFKAYLLHKEANNDPVKKAALARTIVQSIAVIPDAIQKEIYIKECSEILQLSERVLFDTLAQLESQKQREQKIAQQRSLSSNKKIDSLSVVQDQNTEQPNTQTPTDTEYTREDNKTIESDTHVQESFQPQKTLEHKIIALLVLYGNEQVEFEDFVLKEDQENKVVLSSEFKTYKVYNKVFLDLQEDEIAFTDPMFKELYQLLLKHYQNQDTSNPIDTSYWQKIIPQHLSQLFSSIIMDEEKYQLHRWHDKEIHVKSKRDTLSKYVTDIILNFRRVLISAKIEEIVSSLSSIEISVATDIMDEIQDYYTLRTLIANKLSRVVLF